MTILAPRAGVPSPARRFVRSFTFLPVLFGAPCFAAGERAPAQAPRADGRWEEIVVVANHLPRAARLVGSSVTVLDAADIDLRRIDLAAELLREVPGVAVSRSGQVGNVTQVRIRGAEGNHTLVLIDGIEANDPGFGSEFNFADLMTYDIGRVEVLRGPQSALYGSEAIGGVISITTLEPTAGLEAHAEAQGGSFGTRQLGASIAGGTDTVSGRLSAMGYDTDGISASAIEPEKDGYETRTLHGKLDVDLGDRFRARAAVRQSDNEVESDRQDFDFPPTATEGLIVDSDDVAESRQRHALLQFDAQLLDGRWLQRAALSYTDTRSDNLLGGERLSGNRGERRKLEYQSTLRLGDGAWRHALTGAVQRELLSFEALSVEFPDANQARDDDQTSYVAEYALTFERRGSVSLGVRHDDNHRFDDATTWRATGSWLFESSMTRLHGSYGEGITNPSFVELFGFLPSSFRPNPGLEPERARGYDLGVEQSLFGGRLVADLTWFETDLDHEIVTVFDPVAFVSTVINQPGESERRGVELTVDAELGGGWSLQGSYTWLDATDPDGTREVRRPRHSGAVNVNYAFAGGRGNLNLGLVHQGAQQDNEFISATPETRVTLDDYLLANAALSWRVSPRFELFLRGENLLDEDYSEVFGYRAPGAAGYAGLRARL